MRFVRRLFRLLQKALTQKHSLKRNTKVRDAVRRSLNKRRCALDKRSTPAKTSEYIHKRPAETVIGRHGKKIVPVANDCSLFQPFGLRTINGIGKRVLRVRCWGRLARRVTQPDCFHWLHRQTFLGRFLGCRCFGAAGCPAAGR